LCDFASEALWAFASAGGNSLSCVKLCPARMRLGVLRIFMA
jgi:hypothetical protein